MGMNLHNIMVTTMDCMFYKYGVMVFIIVVVDGNYGWGSYMTVKTTSVLIMIFVFGS